MYMGRDFEETNDSLEVFGSGCVSFEIEPLVFINQPIGEHRQSKEPTIQEPLNDDDHGIKMEEEEGTIEPKPSRLRNGYLLALDQSWHVTRALERLNLVTYAMSMDSEISILEPRFYEEAMSMKFTNKWWMAMKEEMSSLYKNKTCTIVP